MSINFSNELLTNVRNIFGYLMTNLYFNKIGNEGAKHISKTNWKHLHRLNLSFNLLI